MSRYTFVNAITDAVAEPVAGETIDLETLFCANYDRVARVIARVVQDPARAEELAVEVFLKLWKNPPTSHVNPEGWLYRVAVRLAVDELRREARRQRYESLLHPFRKAPTPEDLHSTSEQQKRVRRVLASLTPLRAQLLLLRNEGFNYTEIAVALDLNPASVGTLLSRAQSAFRKEYIERYGEQ